MQGHHNAIPMTNTKSGSNAADADVIEPVSLSDIVVQKDFNMSIDAKPGSSAGGTTDHYVQITTHNNRVHLPGAVNDYYGRRG
jgi:hypothetical protein